MRGGFSAPRRPRSAFKESSQEDAVSLRAPRERSRKEKPVLGSSASSSSRSRNNKKKRSALSEVQFPGSDHDQEEDGYETMEQLSPSPSRCSPVFSDEDDEHPQVRRRRESSSSAPKLKLPQKVPENNIISAGLGLIPRKVRSAYVKRAHEGTSSAPPIPDATATALHCFSGAKVPSPSNCNGRIRSVSPSPSAAKSAKRMKPIGTKPRPAKFLKVSAAFSEQEVEVAEVLFGFASQITSAEENLNDLKAASSSSPSLPPNVSSPMLVSSPISASPSRLAQPTEGPKKKRPRPTKIDEIGSPAAPATALAYCQSTGVEIGSSDNADGVGGFTNEITNVLPHTTSATQNHTTSSSFGQRYGELTRETVTVSEKISVKFEDSDVVAPLPEAAKTADIPVKVEGVSESERNQIEAEKIDRQTDALPSENSIGKFESPVLSPSIVDAKTTSLEKMEIDLMVPPEKEANISEIDSTIIAADTATTELPAEGTMGVSSAFEGKSISVDKVRDQEKREDSAEYKEGEKSSCKGDLIEESVVERYIKVENIKEESQVDSMRGNDNDSSKLLPQKQERITNTDSRMQKQEKPDVPSLAVSASCAVSCSTNGVAGPSPISMAVAGWPGALSALGYFGPAAATWPGPSLPGMMPVEGNLMKGIQRWQMLKRSATHAYIAHFIDYQQQMARNPFWTAAYGNPTALYGGKPYNMNIPFAPATEPILGSSLPGSDPFLSARNSNIMGSSFNESNIATAALAAISGHNLKEKATSSYMDVLRKPQQQEVQPTSSVTIQPNLPNFGFPITESGASTSVVAVNTGNACPLVNGKNSGTGPPLPAGASTNLTGGTGAANSSLASMASAQAQYLAMFPQTGFHFPLPPMHFGATNSGTHNHHEHPQIFNGSFYAAHLLHPPSHPQQQGQQNQSNTGSSSQKHQQQFNFSSPQHQTPSSSQQHHLFSSSQTSQAESGYTNGVDAASTADRKLPLGQKNLYSQDSPINSNNNANSVSLLAPNSTGHSQDFTLMTAFGGKNNVKQQQMQVSMQSHGFDPSMEMSLKGQQCNQSTKQAVGRVKGMAQSTPSNYGDHITGASNLSKSQEASISGQSHKPHDQRLPEWKVSSAMPTSAGTSHQAVVAGPIRNSSQQVRHQQVSSNLLANLAGGAIPQAVFTTSTKNYGQQSRNQHSNSSPAAMSKSKTTGIPTSKTLTGGKATASLPQRSIAPTSGKRSSPNHMSPSSSGNKPLQQQQQQQPQQTTQSATTIGPGQVTGSKNQQYYTQAHFNPQQSYSQQIHQQLLFQQKHYLQQPVQQSQLSSQPAQHAVVHQQHLQIPGLNYSQSSVSNRHPQQDQRQQILPASVTPSDQVPGSTLSSGLPSLSLGSTSSGRSPAKILPAGLVKANHTGTTVLHEQYNSLNDMASTQKQSDSPHPTLSPHCAQAASVLQKSPEQKSESDGLHQDEVNGVHFVDLNICAQARTIVSTSSVQTSSIQKTTGNLKMVQGGNNEESMSGQGGTNLSGVPSGHTYQDLGIASSEQTPPMPFQQTPVSRASGPISSVINSPHEAVASIAHL